MPGLYGLGSNVTVNSSNTTGLYAVANVGNVYTGNISSSNTTGLYIGAGTPTFLNNAELLLLLLDNNGNVNFALDPTTNNTTVYSYFVGNIDNYSNANVAAFLPGYTGTLDNSVSIINLLANAGVQAVSINTINANLGAFETYANATFATGSMYSNANVAAYLPINSANVSATYFIGDGGLLTNIAGVSGTYGNSNVAAYLPTYTGSLDLSSSIIALYANAAAQEIDIGTLFSNQTILQNEILLANANIAALDANLGSFQTYSNLELGTLNANLGAFEIYANATFGVSTYGNANVAEYLPTYTGSLDNSSSVINLYANAASQQTEIDALSSNAAGQQTQINTLFANAATQAIDIGTLFSNQTTLQNEILAANLNIDAVNANVTAANLAIAALESNSAGQAIEINSINANVFAANLAIETISANLGAFEEYANLHFGDSNYSNVNVAAYLPTYTGNVGATGITSGGNIDLFTNQNQGYWVQGVDFTLGDIFITGDGTGNAYLQFYVAIPAISDHLPIGENIVVSWGSSTNSPNSIAGPLIDFPGNPFPGHFGFLLSDNFTITDTSNFPVYDLTISPFNQWQFTNTGNIIFPDGTIQTTAPVQITPYGNSNVAAYLPTYTGNVGANAITNTANISVIVNAPQTTFVQTTDFTYGAIAITNDGLGAAYLQFISAVPSVSNLLGLGDAITYDLGGGAISNSIAGPLIDFPGNPNPGSLGMLLSVYTGSAGNLDSITVPASKRWTFTQNNNLVFPDGSTQNTAAPNLPTYGGNVELEYITNGTANWHFDSLGMLTTAGSMTMPAGAYIIAPNEVSTGLLTASTAVKTDNYQFANGTPVTFYTDAAVAAYLPTYGGSIALSQITAGSSAVWLFQNDGKIVSAYPGGAINLGLFSTFSSESGIVDVRGGATTGYGAPGYVYTNTLAGPNQATIPLNITNPTGIKVQAATGTDSLFVGDALLGATDLDLYGNLYARDSIIVTNGVFWGNGDPYAPGSYGNTQVAEYLPNYTGNIANESFPADTGHFLRLKNLQSLTTDALLGLTISGTGVTIDNGLSASPLTVKGNIIADTGYFYIGDGSQLTGLPEAYGNANVAAYLPVYGGNILATVIESVQPYITKIGSNNNNSVTEILGGNNVIISANAGPDYSNAGGIIITAGNNQVKSSGTFYVDSSNFAFTAHSNVNDGNDPSSDMQIYVPAAVYGQFQTTSTEFGANSFSVYDGNVYIGPREHNVPGSGILKVTNRILVNDGGVSLIGNTISTIGVITSGGNVTAPYFIGDGSQLTNVPTSYGNTQVAQYLPTYAGNIGNVGITTGRRYIYGGNIDLVAGATNGILNLRAGSTLNSSDGYITAESNYVGIGSTVDTALVEIFSRTTVTQNNASIANVLTISGNIAVNPSAFGGGNVTARYFIGDGSQLTGIAGGSYGNTQVAAYLPTYTGNIGATITDGTQLYIYDIGSILNATSIRGAGVSILGTGSNITLNTGNASAYVNNIIGKFRSTTNVEVVSGAYFIGDGSKLTGISSSSYGNVEVAAYLPTYTGTLALSSTIVDLYSNAATQATSINTINANLGAFQTYANATFGGGSYGNTQVAAYLPTYTGTLAYTNQTANVNFNNQYVTNAILGTTREKTINLGVIQGTVTIDANSGPIQTATVTANITINTNNLTNLEVGESVTLVLTQNTNANLRVLTSNIKFAAGSKLLSTANAAIDTITIVYDGTNYLASLVKGYA